MSALQAPKKAAEDWHRADVVACLRKKGWSLRQLSKEAGLGESTLKTALDRPYPKAERIIAAAIGVTPETIWPTRYEKRHFKPAFPSVPLVSANHPVVMG
ncbi:transcriptional regulator [Vogesella sp. GCM10023246]|uniref:Helix-turn-helix domain-containing protein n=1 Tax=Vogesella oryzagri TaxID=3160864 RepID=A0ABV1M8P3_9NEIS